MTTEMNLAYQFDFVYDGQKIFRELLNAIANPGTVKNISNEVAKFQQMYAPLLAMGCTLLDNEEKMYVEKNPNLAAELHNLTLCGETELNQADYIFLSSELNYSSMEEVLRHAKQGTYVDPHKSATIILLCGNINGTEQLNLCGPGVKDVKTVWVSPYIKKVIALRNSLQIEYPLGVDLVFTDSSGNLLGIPRLTKIVEQGV